MDTVQSLEAKKLRKLLPPFGVVKGLSIDTAKLIHELQEHDLFNADYTAASSTCDNAENLFVKANMVCRGFFSGKDESSYTEVSLSKPTYSSTELKEDDITRDKFAVYRTKRLDPKSPHYSEHADEMLHNVEEKYLHGELKKVFDFFKGKPCRVRIARMKPGFTIKPHVDYDPSYLFRYHIPLQTNEGCSINVKYKGAEHKTHFASDGRLYWLNIGLLHWVKNEGDTDRYHLLIDVEAQGELQNFDQLEFFE